MLQAVNRIDRNKEIGDYWDSVAKKRINPQKSRASDNWEKRTNFMKLLLNHPLKKDEKILEIGAGLGYTINILQAIYTSRQIYYTSTDTSPIFQRFMRDVQHQPCEIATIDNLPFEDEQFSRVWLFDVLEHVDPGIREKAGQEVGRVLAPHGLIFINNPLSASRHDDKFDFGFSQVDIGNFCEQTKSILSSVTIHSSFKSCFYQFIVLEKIYNDND